MNKKGLPAHRQGFTIIELMVVIAIIALLSVIVLAVIGTARDDAKTVTAKKQLSDIRSQAALYYSTHGSNYNYGNSINYTATGPGNTDAECPSNLTGGGSMLAIDTSENVVPLLDGAKKSLGAGLSPSVRCFVSSQTYSFSAQIKTSGGTFCIDSTQNPVNNKVASPSGCI